MEKSMLMIGWILKFSLNIAQKTVVFIGKVIEFAIKTFFMIIAGTSVSKAGQYNASFNNNPSEIISYWNKGFRVGDKALTLETSSRHLAIFAPSGGGKTMSFFANTLLSVNGEKSFIVRDPNKQLYNLCSGSLKKRNYKIIVINLNDATQSTDAVNPIAGDLTTSDISRISEVIVSSAYEGNTADPYWMNSAKELCYVELRILKSQPKEFHTLYNLKRMTEALAADEKALDSLVVQQAGDDDLMRSYLSIAATPDKTRLNTVSTLKTALQSFNDHNLALATSTTTFEWTSLRNEPTAVFIVSDILADRHLSLIQNLLFYKILDSFMKEIPVKGSLPTQFLCDEASTLTLGNGYLETALSNLRKFNLHIALAYQSPEQLKKQGSAAAESLLAGCHTKIYYPGQSLAVAKVLEDTLGKVTVIEENGSKRIEPLMSATNVMQMQGQAILLCGNRPAILIPILPYYKIWRFKERATIAPAPIVPFTTKPIAKLPL